MLVDMKPVSSWYVLHHNFKVYTSCPVCEGSNISYFKVRTKKYEGVSPVCDDCHKNMPVRFKFLRRSPIQEQLSRPQQGLWVD